MLASHITFDQNAAKMHATWKFYKKHPSGKVGSFDALTVLIVQFDELGEVKLKRRSNF